MNFSQQPIEKKKNTLNAEALRLEMIEYAKDFKVSWVHLGQGLYSIWRDKTFHTWEYDKFEDYVIRELGLKKALALKLVKTYFFVEQEEPGYLKKEFADDKQAIAVPSYEGLDVLRQARRNSEINREDYVKLRKDIFDKGKDSSLVKKDLTAMIKERKQVDPDEEREARHQASVRRFLNALKSFKKDIDTLQLIESDIAKETEELLQKLEEKYL